MKWIKRGLLVISLCLLSLIGLSFYVTEQMMRPGFYEHRTPEQGLKPRQGPVNPRDYGLEFEAIEFQAIDGKTLRGWWVSHDSESDKVIITVHGGGSDRRSYLSLTPALHEAGYPVLLFDNREHGISDGDGLGMSLGMRESEDVVSAVDYLASRGYRQFGVIGNSQGATSAILAAAMDQRIGAVIAQGTGTDLEDMMAANPILGYAPRWLLIAMGKHYYFRQQAPSEQIRSLGVWPIDVIHQIAPRPILIIQGENDRRAPVELAKENYAAAGEPKRLWIVPTGEHRGLRGHAGTEYDQRVVAFFDEHLK